MGGLLVKLHHIDAARLSFITPLILAATLVEVPELLAKDSTIGPALAIMGFFISGITAFLAVNFLMRFFKTERLDPFGNYCIGFGIFALAVLGIRTFG